MMMGSIYLVDEGGRKEVDDGVFGGSRGGGNCLWV